MNQSKHLHAFMSHSVRHILLLISLLIATMCFGQVQTQKGVSYRYNGKNPRTPLPNVTIECVTANNTAISDSTGSFTLVFNKLKMGDRMGLVTVKKREMMVFNQNAIDEWSIRKEPLCLILCDANEFEIQKQELINIGKREAQKKYDLQKAELERQLADNQIDRTRYEVKLDSAWQELDRLHKHIDEYADLFARIDQSEIDPDAQRAMDLFNQGQVDEAVRLFEQGQYLEKLKSAKAAKKQAKELKAKIEDAEAQATQDSIEAVQSLKAQIAAYKVQNEWEKAKTLLKGLADEINNAEVIYDYALFCQNQNCYNEAKTYYHKVLTICRQLAKDNPTIYEPCIANTLNNLSNVYAEIQLLIESEAMSLEALEISRRLAKEAPKIYEPDIAKTLNNLAILYNDTQRLIESEVMFKEALEIDRRLAMDNPQNFEPDVAMTLNNLGVLYKDTQRFTESETLFEESLDIYRRFAKINPQNYEPDVAMTLNNLGSLYYITHRFRESEIMFLEALEIRKRLADNNPQAYEPDVARTLNNLALLYSNTQRLTESKSLYLETLSIQRRLAKANPKAYEPDLANTLHNIAIYYGKNQQLTESETICSEALEIYRHLAKDAPQVYQPYLAENLLLLGLLHLRQEHYLKAIPVLEESLAVYRTLAQNNPTYQDFYESSLKMLSSLYEILYEASEERLPILKADYQDDTETHQDDYVNELGNQSFQCVFVGQLEKAEQYAKEALSIDSNQHWINTNLAAALLFQGKYTEAEQIYRQYKDELKDRFFQDFNDFEVVGIIPEERKADVEKIRKLLSE